MRKSPPILFFFLLLSACGPSATAAPMTTEPPLADDFGCISSNPTQADIDRALAYSGNLFDVPEWERTYTVADGRVSVAWSSTPLAAVAYLEALIFPCGYEEPDLDFFFSDENWEIIFENYEGFEHVDECRTTDGLRLYQFIGVDDGYEYDIHYWARNDTDTRVITMMTVFPIESEALIEEYARRLFPALLNCP
ncbi:MAG: hypothetical protein QY332_01390 [Anaerolineales bacterium]|nr:MAG: hypothetical protein QY332_01390 [Anaerolineales bacterium]